MSDCCCEAKARRAELADVPAIHDITQEAFLQYATELGLPGRVAALKETPDDICRELSEKLVLICHVNGEPKGSVRLAKCGEIGYISRFGVKKASQGGGVGKLLLELAKEEALAMGLKALALHTSTRMFAQMRFYYSNGFYVHSTRSDRGYIRGLLICDLTDDAPSADLSPVLEK